MSQTPSVPAVRAILDRCGRLLRRVSEWSAYAAAAILGACVVLSVIDILLRNAMNSGIPGIVDLTQLTVMWAAFLSIPVGFVLDNHISVDLVVEHLGPRARALLTALASAAGAGFLALCLWWGWAQAAMQLAAGDRSMTIGIPLIWYWVPLLYGAALSALCALSICARATIAAIGGEVGAPAGAQP